MIGIERVVVCVGVGIGVWPWPVMGAVEAMSAHLSVPRHNDIATIMTIISTAVGGDRSREGGKTILSINEQNPRNVHLSAYAMGDTRIAQRNTIATTIIIIIIIIIIVSCGARHPLKIHQVRRYRIRRWSQRDVYHLPSAAIYTCAHFLFFNDQSLVSNKRRTN